MVSQQAILIWLIIITWDVRFVSLDMLWLFEQIFFETFVLFHSILMTVKL
jgi:hypothetical protein